MGYLVAVILLNTLIFTLFKLFPRYGIDALQAITVNYSVCVITGVVVSGNNPFQINTLGEPWLSSALILGVLLIVLFNLLSYSTKVEGVTVTTITNKLSIVIPVIFSYILYNEEIGPLKIAGIILAVPAVVLSVYKKGALQINKLWLPLIIFISSGFMDTFIKYVQHFQLPDKNDQALFTIVGFAVAAVLGSIAVLYRGLAKKVSLTTKSVIAGVFLGIPNYFSIYYFIRLFDSGVMQSSAIVPVNNIGIIVTTTIVAILFFKEKATKYRLSGLILSVISIILIAISDLYG